MKTANRQTVAGAWMVSTALALALAVYAGLPAWALILIVSACFLPICALGCWLLFDQ